LLPIFNQIVGTVVTNNIFGDIRDISCLFLVAVSVGLLSGIYPAIFLSGFNSISSLKGNSGASGTGLLLRRSLVVAQFSISIFLIVATAVIYMQLNFMQNQQLGFQKNHKLVIDYQFDGRINQHIDDVKQQLMAIPGVTMVSLSSSIPGTANNQFNTVIENSRGEKRQQKPDVYFIDDNFLKQFQINVIAGRGFSKALETDTMRAMLVNEAMVKSLGFTHANDIIGKHFTQLNHQGTVVGVVSDFHNHSFLEKVQPLTLRVDPVHLTNITLDIASQDVRPVVGNIQRVWNTIAPGLPFVYFFADDAYDRQYLAQERFGQLFICFAWVAIAISCLGLLGLSAYNIRQRRKEIGVRKVLGASISGITTMLFRDFVWLIVIAMLIASPIAWFFMHKWLQNFAYRIDIPFWLFAISGLTAIVVALFTIGFQSVKAAAANPIKNLRSE
jgi:putative ABC transport system permease protein